jgi:FkbM family methyltransferase
MTNPITINDRPMRIAWGSNSPLVPGGYGMTTSLVAPRLRDRLGIDVAISATYGHYGRKIVWQGIDIYPPGALPFGNDIHAANAKQHRADLLLTHADVWCQLPDKITAGGTRWVSWQPLDAEPVAPTIIERLKDHCYQPIALSHFGARQAALAGLPMPTVIQGIDTNIFVPGDRSAARRSLGWPQDAFIVGMVARNSGYPSRKAYPQQLEAFAQFARQHSDAMLYLHAFTDMGADAEVTPILWQLERYGLMGRVILPSNFDLNIGYSSEQMVLRYQAMDVLLQVSMSEGFGIPLIEAQSVGIPIITGAWTAMQENCYAGWLVAKEDSEPWPVSPLECFWRLPHIDAITEQLEHAYSDLQVERVRAALAKNARMHVVAKHDQDYLIDYAWRPVLEDIARRIEQEPIPWHVHHWAGWGHETDLGVVRACLIPDCPAEHAMGITAPTGFSLTIDGITLDIADDPNGGVRRAIATEIETVYRLQDLTFHAGDVILDIGAHVGVVACYLAKKWSNVWVYAFEPVAANYARLMRNLAANGIKNVTAYNAAVTADGRDLTLSGDAGANTGGYSAFSAGGPNTAHAASCPADGLFADLGIDHVALLKLDCEGAEYEILRSLNGHILDIDNLIMEVHENEALRHAYGSGAALIADMEQRIPFVRSSLIRIPDAPEAIEASITTGVPSCLPS